MRSTVPGSRVHHHGRVLIISVALYIGLLVLHLKLTLKDFVHQNAFRNSSWRVSARRHGDGFSNRKQARPHHRDGS